jgi:lipopolysaccharide export system protein LptA
MMKNFLLSLLILLGLNVTAVARDVNLHTKKQPVEITSDSLEIIQDKQQAIFTGKVEAKQGNLHIQADKMLVYYNKKDSKNNSDKNSVSKVEASGNVFLTNPTETAQGQRGVFDVDKNLITLSQNVILTSGKNVVKGDKLVYNLTTGESKMDSNTAPAGEKKGRVRGVFMPNN